MNVTHSDVCVQLDGGVRGAPALATGGGGTQGVLVLAIGVGGTRVALDAEVPQGNLRQQPLWHEATFTPPPSVHFPGGTDLGHIPVLLQGPVPVHPYSGGRRMHQRVAVSLAPTHVPLLILLPIAGLHPVLSPLDQGHHLGPILDHQETSLPLCTTNSMTIIVLLSLC